MRSQSVVPAPRVPFSAPSNRRGQPRLAAGALLGVTLLAMALPSPVEAADPDKPWWFTAYLQQSFPKQTNTNKQIEQINAMFGTEFDTWDDVVNLNLGLQLFKQVAPKWKVGLQFDYSQGGIDGEATVETEAGPAQLAFEQSYSTYADLYAVAHFLPCPDCEAVVPFLYGGIGIA